MERNNLDMAMLLTDAILNEFEKNGRLDVPLDEHKYSFDLQDVIQSELEKIRPTDYLNKIVKVKVGKQEMYGKVTREYSSEVLVAVEVNNEISDTEIYFKKLEVEIVDERI